MQQAGLSQEVFFWLLQGVCSLHRRPFSMPLAQQALVAPHTVASFSTALTHYALQANQRQIKAPRLSDEFFPLVVWLALPESVKEEPIPEKAPDKAPTLFPPDNLPDTAATQTRSAQRSLVPSISTAIVLQANASHVLMMAPGDTAPSTVSMAQFQSRYLGWVTRVIPQPDFALDEDSEEVARQARKFGFRWFIPELVKYKKLWYEVLLASLVIQLIALSMPLFTQAMIDKVVVHRTQSTLMVIAAGMFFLTLFSAALSWLRQYLILHTGNRVDAVLGASVFAHLFKLPPLYFQHRPTGVIAARMQGMETIREFIASAAVTLVLDCPFLLIFVAIMFYYSITLTLIVLAILALIVVMSLVVAPLFQARLQEQFQMHARNQAFLTEYVAGMETVKSLQLEPQLNRRYGSYLASALTAGFATRQLANTYNTASNLLEQMMSLLILTIGAYTVMHQPDFTIGMLIAFQMFSSRLSQPMLRLVGLWQQFQQASLSVKRLGDLMNAPPEPYSLTPAREATRKGDIQIRNLAFKYTQHQPLLYENLSLSIKQGQTIGIMGPSGCGKSTLAKLLQGFYQPTSGQIWLDGVDIAHLCANELRSYFGIVPQETVLFSGTIHDNLQMASPNASFEQIMAACKMAEIHDVISALPQGYQTEIGERGAGLSGGQRQRIAIARALLKRPGILVFDEATSALDEHTARQFARTINALKGKVTILFITHGLPQGLKTDAVFCLTPKGAQRVPVVATHEGAAAQPEKG